MKHINFFAILTLAITLAGCTKESEQVVEEPTTQMVSFPVEVDLGCSESRVFDDDLHWSWQPDDVIYGSQINRLLKYVNPLTLNENDRFANPEFYALSSSSAYYLFAYPTLEVKSSGWSTVYQATAIQNGEWRPVLAGLTTEKISTESLKSGDYDKIALKHLSAAFEIRVWEVGGRESGQRMNISKATITSDTPFLGVWKLSESGGKLVASQSLSGNSATVETESDTVVFNVAEGTFPLTLTLEAANGEAIIVPVELNFVAGKRTVLNVEWKRNVYLDSATSWYEQYKTDPETTLEAGAIYLNNLTWDSGTPTVYVDGSPAEVVDNKITTTSGWHEVYAAIDNCRTKIHKVFVCSKPTLEAGATIHSSYNNANGDILRSNDYRGDAIYISDLSLNDPVAEALASVTVTYWEDRFLGSLSKKSVETDFADGYITLSSYGKYKATATVKLDNGYICGTVPEAAITVTGIPSVADFTADDYKNWSWFSPASLLGQPTVTVGEVDLVLSKFSCLILEPQLENPMLVNEEHSVVITSPTFYVPTSTNVRVGIVAQSANSDAEIPFSDEVTIVDKAVYRNTYIEVPSAISFDNLIGSFVPKMGDTFIEGDLVLIPTKNAAYKYCDTNFTLTTTKRRILLSRFFKYHKQYISKIRVEYAE